MKIEELTRIEYYRDGGSYEAVFSTDDGGGYGLWLQRSRMPDHEGTHHRWLFEYRGAERPTGCIPLISGSEEEEALIGRLEEFLARNAAAPHGTVSAYSPLELLADTLRDIRRREYCTAADVQGWRANME